MRIPLSVLLLPLIFSSSLFASESDNSDKIYSFAIVPQQAASKLARQWSPLLAHITTQTGIKLRFVTTKNIPVFEEELLQGSYDFAYMNPYHYVVFHDKQGYNALNNAKEKRINGIIVVKKDSEITTLQQLADSELAFPSPAAFAASILPRASLSKLGIAFTPKYVMSHDSVYLSVAKGLYPAGGGIMRTFNSISPQLQSQLSILWKSPGYTPHAIAAHPNVAAELQQRVQQALTDLDTTEEGRKLLEPLSIKGWQNASDSDWDDVRDLNIQLLQ